LNFPFISLPNPWKEKKEKKEKRKKKERKKERKKEGSDCFVLLWFFSFQFISSQTPV